MLRQAQHDEGTIYYIFELAFCHPKLVEGFSILFDIMLLMFLQD